MEIPFQNRWLTLAIVSAALFLVVIDMTVLYTALPSLAQALRTTASEKLWILNAYSLVMAGLMSAYRVSPTAMSESVFWL